MITKSKKMFLVMLLFLAAAVLFAAGGSLLYHPVSAAENGVSAQFVAAGADAGNTWWTTYGKNGYVVFGNTANGFYSDMYTEHGNDGKTEIVGWRENYKYYYMSQAGRETVDSDAPVTQWGITAQSMASANQQARYKLTAPGSYEVLENARNHFGGEQKRYNDSSVLFTLREDTPVYFTINIMDYAQNNDLTAAPIKVEIYNSAQKGYSSGSENIAEYYTGSADTQPLAEAQVTGNATYVTFLLEGAGDYQVIYYATDGTETTASKVQPMCSGFFFDSMLPEPAVTFAGEETVADGDWEGRGYGKDGYVVYWYDQSAEGADKFRAYTKGMYQDENGDPYTGLITYQMGGDASKFDGSYDEFIADKELSGDVITRYGQSITNFLATTGEKTLQVPGSEEHVNTRVAAGASQTNAALAFSLSEEVFEQYRSVEVTVYHGQCFGGNLGAGAPEGNSVQFKTGVYGIYYPTAVREQEPFMPMVASHTVAMHDNGPFYVTYRFTQPGNYSIYIDYFQAHKTDGTAMDMRGEMFGFFYELKDQKQDYTITYELGDDDLIQLPADAIKTYRSGSRYELPVPTRENGIFLGWFTDAGLTQPIEYISADTTGNLTLYPSFKISQTYTVEYVLGTGETVPENALKSYVAGRTYSLPQASKQHSTFIGWFTDSGLTQPLAQITAETEGNLTLYPKFEYIKWDVTLELNVDDAAYLNEELTESLADAEFTYNYYEDFTFPDTLYFEDDGLSFEGWYEDADFEYPVEKITAGEWTGAQTYYGKVVAVRAITYVLNGGANAASNPATYTEGTAVTLASPTKDGFTFGGWYTNAEFSGAAVTEISASQKGDVTLYAEWLEEEPEPAVSKITYVLNGGTNAASNPATYTEGTAVTLASPTKEGSTFGGWYTDEEFSGTAVTEISASQKGDVTLYAKWVENQPENPGDNTGGDNVSDDAGGGCSGMAAGVSSAGAAVLASAGAVLRR